MNNSILKTLLLSSIVLSLAACNRGDTAVPWTTTAVADSVPNEFASYVNKQHSLSAGDYTAVIATNSAGQSASYTLSISFDDGSSETRTGLVSVSSGPGTSCDGTKRPCQVITLQKPGGLTLSLSSSVASQVSLLDRAGNVVHSAGSSIAISSTKVDGDSYSNAYYNGIDPAGERSNLAKWKAKNGFNSGTGTTVSTTFRDVNDLGYGRHLTAHKNTDGSMAFMVDNYLVDISNGDSSANYSALNLDAAVQRAKQFHVGTNAIEFSPQVDGGDAKIVKFYTFLPGATDADSTRRNSIDMDGRGAKSVPSVCLSCHGGRILPVTNDGSFNSLALSSAKLNLLDIDSFDPPNGSAFTAAELAVLKEINIYISSSFPADKTVGEWDGSYALEVAQGRSTADFVPTGWQDDTAWIQDPAKKNPTGTELLFKQVVEPHCYSCHALQGTSSSSNGDNFTSTSVNFSSYEKFKKFESKIVEYVYRRGNMPLSLRNYERFWLDPAGAPTLLAAHLGSAYDIKDSSGNPVVRQPGMPFAKAGADRVVASPVSLNGSASLLASTYQWSVVSSPSGALTSLTTPRSVQTSFSATIIGSYELQLTVTNSVGSSTDNVTINISSILASSHKIYSFNTDIRPILGSDNNSGKCTQCHSDGGTPLTPVFYTDAGRTAANASSLYSDVMARVNLNDPENSLILHKPAGNNHVGGTVSGFASSADVDYQVVLNWIREGALP